MHLFRMIRWLIWKDLISEFRNREQISSMFFFATIVVLIFGLSIRSESANEMLPGMIWVAFAFTGVIGFGRSFLTEVSNDCIDYLKMVPVHKGVLFLGKWISNTLFMFTVELTLYPLFIFFFNLDILDQMLPILFISLLATIGFSALGTLFSALTVQVRSRDVMLPLLLFPLSIPVFIGAVEATRSVFNGDPFSVYRRWMELLLVFDIVFTIVSFWVFEFVFDE